MQGIRLKAGLVFSFSAATLVFFNYLYFLKWYQLSGSRLWVVGFIVVSAPFAIFSFRDSRRLLVLGVIVFAYCGYTLAGYFVFRGPEFNIRYLCQFLLTVIAFAGAGVLAGRRPAGVICVVLIAGGALLLALPVAWIEYGSLWKGDDFRNILGIPQIPGRVPYYSYYQLVAYGIALAAIPVFIWLLSWTRTAVAIVFGLAITLLLAELGSRTIFLLLPLVFTTLLFHTGRHAHAVVLLGLSVALATGVFYTPLGRDVAVAQRMEGEAERYAQGAIFRPKTDGGDPYDAAGAFDAGDGGDHRTWSRRTLFDFALKGWLADPASFIFGHGLGSYSLDLTGIYPGWLPAPHEGEVYPHNWILEAGYEGGAVAVLLLGLVLLFPFWRSFSEPKCSRGAQSIVGMYLLVFGAAFLSGGIALNYTLFFLAGAASSAQEGKSLIEVH
ncbi:uncharacterized membrane protein YidH (DUF202 family) [Rhizobium sp. BK650]|uniref:hypothetical protein n=1 Tax=Rhizobium sp. BK650 TaxID=2586990 RepID=UPI00162256DD|nr:hypothetical protein [Rhizobium sp. BK650]MBB3659773.1 uncharacterized membrane protein YidH (DUF202 family) [Rhizobium sp. BK650]